MGIRSQKMAQDAYKLVSELATPETLSNEKEKAKKRQLEGKYRTLALNFPTMILQSGLSQAVGFLLAKSQSKDDKNSDSEHKILLQHLEKLLKDSYDNKQTFHNAILSANLSQYQLLTRKALDATSTLKRYTQALLKSADDKGQNNE